MESTIYIISFLILITASLIDLLVPVIIGFRYPDYNHLVQTISTLGTYKSPVKKYESTNLKIVGTLFIVFSILQYIIINESTWAYNWYTAGIIVYGVGCILAGFFSEDEKNTPETLSGKIHGISSGIGFIFLILNPLWALWINQFRNLITINLILFILGIITFVLFLLSESKINGILKYTGLFQRLNLIILYLALILNYSFIH